MFQALALYLFATDDSEEIGEIIKNIWVAKLNGNDDTARQLIAKYTGYEIEVDTTATDIATGTERTVTNTVEVDLNERDFFLSSWSWLRENYEDANVTEAGLKRIWQMFSKTQYDGDPTPVAFHTMKEEQFTKWWEANSPMPVDETLWWNLNGNPGAIWEGMDGKDKVFITLEGNMGSPPSSGFAGLISTSSEFSSQLTFTKDDGSKTTYSFFTGAGWNANDSGYAKMLEKIFLDEALLTQAIGPLYAATEGDESTYLSDPKEFGPEEYKSFIAWAKGDRSIFDFSSTPSNLNSIELMYAAHDIPMWWREWIADQVDLSSDEAVAGAGMNFNRTAAVATGVPGATFEDIQKALKEEDLGYVMNQCVVSAKLAEMAGFRKNLRKKMYNSGCGAPYGRRVYCVNSTKQNLYMNYLTVPSGFNDIITETNDNDFTDKYEYGFHIYKIEEGKNGENKKYEFLFETPTNKSTIQNIKFQSLDYSANSGSYNKTVFGVKENAIFGGEKIEISNVNISVAGETIATVKSNIDVSMEFKFNSIEVISAVFAAPDPYKKGGTYEFSLLELLTQQAGMKYKGSQASRALKSSYVATRNRLAIEIVPRLVVKKVGGKPVASTLSAKVQNYFNTTGPIMYDLTLLKYDLTKNPVGQGITLKIHYKGYIKSFLNSPMCDVLQSTGVKQKLLNREKETIKELEKDAKYCEIKHVRKKLTSHFKKMTELKTTDRQYDFILDPLINRGMLFQLEVGNIRSVIEGNIDLETNKLIKPELLRNVVDISKIQQVKVNETTTRISLEPSQKIQFFFFGDLVDVLLDTLYGEAKFIGEDKIGFLYTQLSSDEVAPVDPTPGSRPDIYEFPKRTSTIGETSGTTEEVLDEEGETVNISVSEIKEKFKNFLLKVLMPTFHPIDWNAADEIYTTDTNKEISVADVPVSLGYFYHWFEKEIIDREVKTYPVGGMMNNILNSLVNNVLADKCYRSSAIERKYFAVSSDFGAYNPVSKAKNLEGKKLNQFALDRIREEQSKKTAYNGFVNVGEVNSPIIEKSTDIERSDHCNFLIINELMNSYGDFDSIDLSKNKKETLSNLRIPVFKTDTILDDGKKIGFVEEISLKKTTLPYGEEIRFSKDGLNELSMLSAVHDATIKTNPLFHLYPGQVCWIDAGFLEGTEIYGSIPWVTGMGGWNVVTSVSHAFDVSNQLIVPATAVTTIESKHVSTGATEESSKKHGQICKNSAAAYNESLPEPTNTTAEPVTEE